MEQRVGRDSPAPRAGERSWFRKLRPLWIAAWLVLIANSIYLYLNASATIFYLVNVGVHLGLGVTLGVSSLIAGGWYLVLVVRRNAPGGNPVLLWLTALAWTLGILLGGALAFTGTTRPMTPLLNAHIAACVVGLVLLGCYLRSLYVDVRTRRTGGEWWRRTQGAWLLGALLLPAVFATGLVQSHASARIINPEWAPESMKAETADPRLHPSSIQIKGATWMPDAFFTETSSRSCGEAGCHPDIYKQWYGSAHHFSSFNNQWYRKAIEYMQEVQVKDALDHGFTKAEGLRKSQWCAGCHDPSILLTGRWQKDSIKAQLSEAERDISSDPQKLERLHSGLGCLMCHSVTSVNSTMGQADLTLEYPALHKYAESSNPLMKKLHNYFTILDPRPHRALFLKSFQKDSTAEFCSGCHKVHLDVPVNGYKWFRGFDDYDGWQQSGVSGMGARSFYYPPKSKSCADCHMPMVRSKDRGNHNGYIHTHEFPAANTAIFVANQEPARVQKTVQFLQNKVLSVDIFALRRGGAVKAVLTSPQAAVLQSASLEGDENGIASGGVGLVLDSSKLSAPLGLAPAALKRGESVGIDVVVRTRGMGHPFPGGTVDAFDTWVELKAEDNKGHVLMWSGKVADDGKGAVDPTAHFYRAFQIDEKGHPINKRNAWAARAVVYANIIPPGAADTVHYRLRVPQDCGDHVTLTARVNYRKFTHYFTQFAYAGRRDPKQKQDFTGDYDNGHFLFDGDTSDVSGAVKAVPPVPIVVLAESTQVLPVTSGRVPPPTLVTPKSSWERWNDYGIGLYRQRDFKAAAAAFRNVLKADPTYGDAHVHLGQTLLDDGQVAAALKELQQAVSMARVKNQQGKAFFHYGRALFASGRQDEAIHYFTECGLLFPHDREVSNQLGLVLISKGDYAGAEAALRRTLKVDPEDLTANYNLIKAYRGLRSKALADRDALERQRLAVVDLQRRQAALDAEINTYSEDAARVQKLYERFRADETAGQRTANLKRLDPADNNEAQLVHEHT